MKYPETPPPYLSLTLGTFCASLIARIEYIQGDRFWWFTLAIVAVLWLWVGTIVYLRDKANK